MQKPHLVGMVMATLLEAKSVIDSLAMEPVTRTPFKVFQKGNQVLLICGVGKANAAMGTTYLILKYGPSVIYNIGAAGALVSSYALGDIFAVVEIIDYERINIKTRRPFTYRSLPTKGVFPETNIATLDRPVLSTERRQRIGTTACLVDMECASIYQTCRTFGTPCYIFKFVSDVPSHTQESDIVQYIRQFREPFYVALKDYLS